MLLLTLYAFGLGAIIGSFLNVVIHRYPLGESIVFPASHCPLCKAKIRPWDNVPVLAWIWLGGRCRDCRAPISARYPLVELANALFYAAVFQRTGLSFAFPCLAALVSMTIVLIYIDLDIQILPDVINYTAIVLGLLFSAFSLGATAEGMTLAPSLRDALLGGATGSILLFGLGWAYKVFRHVDGMGLGDVKMIAWIGLFVGITPLLPVVFLASVCGATAGILLALARKTNLQVALPFGVFLGLAFLGVVFFGPTLFAWYLSLLVG